MKDIVRYVILGILLVAIIVLGIMAIFKGNNQESVKYQFYDDDLIEIDNQTSMDVQANVVDSGTLGVLVTSNLNDFFLIKVEVNYYDDDYEIVSTLTNEATVFDHGKQFFMFLLPDLYEKYAGAIDIKVTAEKTDDGLVSTSELEMTETHSVDDTLTTNFNVQVTNNSDDNIPGFLGGIVLLKENKVVGYQFFNLYDLNAHSTLSSEITFNSKMDFSDYLAVDFDEVILFPTSIFTEDIGELN